MFGAGFVLLLAGSFFDRIQSITGPGGVGIVLKATGKDAAEAIAKLEDAITKHHRRISYANSRITELRKRVATLEDQVGPPSVDAIRAEVEEDEELREAETELQSAQDDVAAASAARQRLLNNLNLLP
jgi:phage shock protein A